MLKIQGYQQDPAVDNLIAGTAKICVKHSESNSIFHGKTLYQTFFNKYKIRSNLKVNEQNYSIDITNLWYHKPCFQICFYWVVCSSLVVRSFAVY